MTAATFERIFASEGESVKEIRLSNYFFFRSRNADPWRRTALLTAFTWRDRHQAAYDRIRGIVRSRHFAKIVSHLLRGSTPPSSSSFRPQHEKQLNVPGFIFGSLNLIPVPSARARDRRSERQRRRKTVEKESEEEERTVVKGRIFCFLPCARFCLQWSFWVTSTFPEKGRWCPLLSTLSCTNYILRRRNFISCVWILDTSTSRNKNVNKNLSQKNWKKIFIIYTCIDIFKERENL